MMDDDDDDDDDDDGDGDDNECDDDDVVFRRSPHRTTLAVVADVHTTKLRCSMRCGAVSKLDNIYKHSN